jgi:hypothetical protein
MDRQTKTQDEVITKTQTQNLHKMRLTLKKEQYHLQSYRVFLRDLNQKKMSYPPFHMEKEGGAKV